MRFANIIAAAALLAAATPAFAQTKIPSNPYEQISFRFNDVNRRVLEMAKDFPEAKYKFKATPEVRSFGEVVLHILAGNAYAAKRGRGENVQWDEVDPKQYTTKAQIVELLEKSINDSSATLKGLPPSRFTESLAPWLAVIVHNEEHYGQLVVYYRINGLVPPESRPKK